MSTLAEKSSPTPVPAHLAAYPTPLHVYYEENLLADATELEEGLKSTLPESRLYYSTKTNSLLPILKALLGRGWGLEVVGPKDRSLALQAGAAGDRMLLNGPAWSRRDLEQAIFEQGIRSLTLDSECMAELLGAVLKSRPDSPKLRIALRIHDGNSHFGFHPHREHFERAWNSIPRNCIENIGFHIHSNPGGSIHNLQELTADFRHRAQRINLALASILTTPWKDLVRFCDLGGGIDSPYIYRLHPADFGEFHNPKGAAAFRERHANIRFSLREAGAELGRAVREELGAFWQGKEVFFEPGRSVCTRALSTLVEVKSVKRHFYPDSEVILTDGNTAILGPVHRGVHQISPAGRARPITISTFVYGNLPHSGDWLFQDVKLPPQHPGDRLLISHTGAYFQPLEASFGNPLPMVIRADRDEVVKQ